MTRALPASEADKARAVTRQYALALAITGNLNHLREYIEIAEMLTEDARRELGHIQKTVNEMLETE